MIFAEDIHQLMVRIIELEKTREEELDMNDAFDLYKQLSAVRELFANALPEYGPSSSRVVMGAD